MQTFLPYSDFKISAACLDNKRLGKQRVETLQILNVLLGKSDGWKNHPAVKMWKGHEYQLCQYGIVCCDRWIKLGFKDTCRSKIIDLLYYCEDTGMPKWMGDNRLHSSHRSNLMRKDPVFYSYGWFESNDIPYFWPTKEGY